LGFAVYGARSGNVIIGARLARPATEGAAVEGPPTAIDTHEAIGTGFTLKRARRKPPRSQPSREHNARSLALDAKRYHGLWANAVVVGGLVFNHGPAKRAILHRHGAVHVDNCGATRTVAGPRIDIQAALLVSIAEVVIKGVFANRRFIQGEGLGMTTVRAGQRLLAWLPFQVGATSMARETTLPAISFGGLRFGSVFQYLWVIASVFKIVVGHLRYRPNTTAANTVPPISFQGMPTGSSGKPTACSGSLGASGIRRAGSMR
jgi:hypothetical protein